MHRFTLVLYVDIIGLVEVLEASRIALGFASSYMSFSNFLLDQ